LSTEIFKKTRIFTGYIQIHTPRLHQARQPKTTGYIQIHTPRLHGKRRSTPMDGFAGSQKKPPIFA